MKILSLMFVMAFVAYSAGAYAACPDAYYENANGQCILCPSGTVVGSHYTSNVGVARHSLPNATSESDCLLVRNGAEFNGQTYPGLDWWCYDYAHHPCYWRVEEGGICYYNTITKMYDICDMPKHFKECNEGWEIDNSTPLNDEFTNSYKICAPGTFAPAHNNIGSLVPAGVNNTYHYPAENGWWDCQVAPVGKYVDTYGASGYKDCPDGFGDNPNTGGADISQCLRNIPGGYFWDLDVGAVAHCPDGQFSSKHMAGYGLADDVCRDLCKSGVTKLRSSTGLNIPIYLDKRTSPSIHIKNNNSVCYIDLLPGKSSDTINVKYNGVIYSAQQ